MSSTWDELYGGQVPSSKHSQAKTYLKLRLEFKMLKKFDEHCENLFFLKSEIMFCFLENENFEKHFENLCSVKSEIIIYIFSGKGAVSI